MILFKSLRSAAPPLRAPPLCAPPLCAPPLRAPPLCAPPLRAPPLCAPPLCAPPLLAPPLLAPPLRAPPLCNILQRKLKSASQWQDLVNFKEVQLYPALPIVQNELAPSNYIDTDTLEFKFYNYRLKAVSEAGKYTYSKMLQVKPYDNGIRGQIQNFAGTVLPPNQYYTDYYIPPFVDANQGSVVQKKPVGSVIRLQWGYNTAYTASLREFKIYVKDNVPANMTDGGLSGKYTLVKTVKKGVAASTAQAIGVSNYAVHVDRLNFILSMAKKVKIVAFHNDGGFSEVAEILVNP